MNLPVHNNVVELRICGINAKLVQTIGIKFSLHEFSPRFNTNYSGQRIMYKSVDSPARYFSAPFDKEPAGVFHPEHIWRFSPGFINILPYAGQCNSRVVREAKQIIMGHRE
jgi:hypothetical protein